MPRSYLVLEADAVIAQDIGETLSATEPGAGVRCFEAPQQAVAWCRAQETLDMAVLHLSVERLRTSGLEAELTRLGAAILLLGGDDSADARDAGELLRVDLPFTSAMILDAKNRLQSGR